MTLDDWMTKEGLDDEMAVAALGVDRSTVNRVRRGKLRASAPFIAACIRRSGGAIDAKAFFAAEYERAA